MQSLGGYLSERLKELTEAVHANRVRGSAYFSDKSTRKRLEAVGVDLGSSDFSFATKIVLLFERYGRGLDIKLALFTEMLKEKSFRDDYHHRLLSLIDTTEGEKEKEVLVSLMKEVVQLEGEKHE